ncbi:MAG TPA: HEPN domain-containing protein [Bacteroidota bacterium]
MTPEQHRSDAIQYWWAKAEESLSSAERELGANSLAFAMNRIYYAAFYAVSAALLDRQASFKKHSGVRAAFHQEFVKPGLLDIKWGKFYDRLFEDRQEGDYIALINFERAYVEDQLKGSREFLAVLNPLVTTLSKK